jgi:hypothetical protein
MIRLFQDFGMADGRFEGIFRLNPYLKPRKTTSKSLIRNIVKKLERSFFLKYPNSSSRINFYCKFEIQKIMKKSY